MRSGRTSFFNGRGLKNRRTLCVVGISKDLGCCFGVRHVENLVFFVAGSIFILALFGIETEEFFQFP